ncbi:UDP-N-acetylmuramate dehydrogenase [Moraxella catarrhalis]|uniref:UDP-N-acetylenolpyruvoylglucosamine reductase n=1 Tax=Moraxella catarrhalis TaxID=480 RepID=A0A198UIF1_MORCA|nr:UDP-N-acetylmuramate dehydrogenase [Moraxella catarrhalis]OAU96069.1 UDP-N-acetylenolpyruvoylglucosamine reductase [Moraxella catarrhalis]OAU96598.1 UDP-N-acetylenolpyruvoylglucosamine reductase [Moraxella catarrhalis]OAV00465.1 UDP-N-acetylenolpyruvoylglucosamine reductase [Moraxella catarrhalis]
MQSISHHLTHDMLDTYQNYDLSSMNTMALSSVADSAVVIHDKAALPTLKLDHTWFVLSGGSNVLLPSRLHATMVLPRMMGRRVLFEDDQEIILEVQAGENFHDLVTDCVHKGWYGLENLALIPGLVGAAPVQNIGAYGVQLDDVLVSVQVYEWASKQFKQLPKQDCAFSYRHSIFKDEPNRYLICAVTLRLHKNPTRILSSYGDLHTYAKQLAHHQGRTAITTTDVYHAVIAIRQSKLPDPKVLANCGSFFQNPIISTEHYQKLCVDYPTLPCYPVTNASVKVPAGWLIDQAGLKGQGVPPILTHAKQALVLTNHAPLSATQEDIKAAADVIIAAVYQKFGITLVREPVWINADGSYN